MRESYSPENINNFTRLDLKREKELSSSETEAMALEAASELQNLDAYINGEKPEAEGSKILEQYKSLVKFLENKTSEELKMQVDKEGRFNPADFSHFSLSVNPPGMICVELGNTQDLVQFRKILHGDSLQGKLSGLVSGGDDRDSEIFAMLHFDPEVFGGGDYLGVVVSVKDKFKDERAKKDLLNHERSHALTSRLIRPNFQRKVVNIDFARSIRDNRQAVLDLENGKALKFAKELDVLPSEGTPEHMMPLSIAVEISRELYLMDELRAYAYSHGILPPKYRTTDADISGQDVANSLGPDTAKKYFELWLLHTKAYLTSKELEARSLAILGASLSLEQAKNLLSKEFEQQMPGGQSTNEHFTSSLVALSIILNHEQYKDFNYGEAGTLISEDQVREMLVVPKEEVDREIVIRFGRFEAMPEKAQEAYKKIY